ncbi:DUF4149 domain-containing protein [Terriglobus tenax]|uniref:DUF4149 domain-containing protein n=1 Tax=Terriglobus tenax TaxID=1111115 RepID=UPI0021DFD7EE|nr:DUF4149 domain-containing protein [Terriglobus tenax]
MVAFLRSLRLLSLIAWMGGIVFFGAIAAPAIFSPQVLELTHGSTHIPGIIVGLSLTRLHWVGLGCGIVLILTTVLLYQRSGRNRMQMYAIVALTALMLCLTLYIGFHVMPLMEHDRELVGGDFTNLPLTNPERADFDRKHELSTRLEQIVLLCALGVTLAVATEDLPKAV